MANRSVALKVCFLMSGNIISSLFLIYEFSVYNEGNTINGQESNFVNLASKSRGAVRGPKGFFLGFRAPCLEKTKGLEPLS